MTQTPIEQLQEEANKSERRAIMFGDALHDQIVAMRAAVVAWQRESADAGMAWIANTLCGPGQLPDVDDIALGAQELFDKEMAEHEAFRAAHPAPVAASKAPLPDLGMDEWLDLASRHANADWNSEQPDGFLNAVKALAKDAHALLSAHPASKAAAPVSVSDERILQVLAQHGAIYCGGKLSMASDGELIAGVRALLAEVQQGQGERPAGTAGVDSSHGGGDA